MSQSGKGINERLSWGTTVLKTVVLAGRSVSCTISCVKPANSESINVEVRGQETKADGREVGAASIGEVALTGENWNARWST